MRVLVDIGGTYARFALEGDGEIAGDVTKFPAAQFQSFEEALYEFSEGKTGALRIATAAYEDGEHWRFVNQNEWVISPAVLKAAGWSVEIVLNDFAAATWGLVDLPATQQNVLLEGSDRSAGQPRCLLGPGTGLGLGYLIRCSRGENHVQRTHGGHMPVAALTDEHWLVVQLVQRLKDSETLPVFENFVSGPGLLNIYRAFCMMGGKEFSANTPEEVLDNSKTHEGRDAIRVFHEFFGLFAANAVVTANSYGGLYLTGGVMDHLVKRDAFDYARFRKFFVLNGVQSVKRDLDQMPVIHVRNPYLALSGLMKAQP